MDWRRIVLENQLVNAISNFTDRVVIGTSERTTICNCVKTVSDIWIINLMEFSNSSLTRLILGVRRATSAFVARSRANRFEVVRNHKRAVAQRSIDLSSICFLSVGDHAQSIILSTALCSLLLYLS